MKTSRHYPMVGNYRPHTLSDYLYFRCIVATGLALLAFSFGRAIRNTKAMLTQSYITDDMGDKWLYINVYDLDASPIYAPAAAWRSFFFRFRQLRFR